MTAKMTDEQIQLPRMADDEILKLAVEIALRPKEPYWNYEIAIFRSAEEIYLPQIQQLQGEIDKLKKDIELTGYIDFEVARGYWHVERAKLISEISQLTAKHEKLVKAAQEFHDYVIMHPVKAFDVPDEIYVPFNKALTEEGNV